MHLGILALGVCIAFWSLEVEANGNTPTSWSGLGNLYGHPEAYYKGSDIIQAQWKAQGVAPGDLDHLDSLVNARKGGSGWVGLTPREREQIDWHWVIVRIETRGNDYADTDGTVSIRFEYPGPDASATETWTLKRIETESQQFQEGSVDYFAIFSLTNEGSTHNGGQDIFPSKVTVSQTACKGGFHNLYHMWGGTGNDWNVESVTLYSGYEWGWDSETAPVEVGLFIFGDANEVGCGGWNEGQSATRVPDKKNEGVAEQE